MVALLNTRIDQEELMPLMEVCHPALLPVMGESLLSRNCRLLSTGAVSVIYVVASQRPEDLEEHISAMNSPVPVRFIIVSEDKSIGTVIRELRDAFQQEEVLYVPSQMVLTEEIVHSCVRGNCLDVQYHSFGSMPLLLDPYNGEPTRFPKAKEADVVDSLHALFQINRVEAKKRKLYSDGVILEGVTIAAAPLNLAFGTSLKNTILMPGVTTDRFEHLENVIVTNDATFNFATGEVEERKRKTLRDMLIRSIDVIGAGVGLLMLTPLFMMIALLIKIDSKGPVFYRSSRAVSPERQRNGTTKGMKEVPFTVFRTMYVNADQMVHSSELNNRYGTGPYKKFDNDCRITRIGHFLRKTSLDELPLLWHVFTGDISLVGTWALPKYEAKAIDEVPLVINDIDFTEVGRARFEGTAGIAGLWQSGGRSDLPAEERAVLDAVQTAMESTHYSSADMPNIRHSIKGYVGMIVTTIRSVILCRGAQ